MDTHLHFATFTYGGRCSHRNCRLRVLSTLHTFRMSGISDSSDGKKPTLNLKPAKTSAHIFQVELLPVGEYLHSRSKDNSVLWSRSNSRYDTVFISRDTCNRDRLLVCTSHILQCTTCATYIRLLLVTRSLWHMVIFELNDLFCLQRDKYNNQLQKNNWSSFATTGLWSDVCCWQIQTTPYSHDKLWCSSFWVPTCRLHQNSQVVTLVILTVNSPCMVWKLISLTTEAHPVLSIHKR